MKKLVIPLLLCCLLFAAGLGRQEPTAFSNRQGSPDSVCAHEGCGRPVVRSGDSAYCAVHSGVCTVCGAWLDEGKSLCDDCAKAQLDELEQTEHHSDIAAFQ
jgi:hypothetical protein